MTESKQRGILSATGPLSLLTVSVAAGRAAARVLDAKASVEATETDTKLTIVAAASETTIRLDMTNPLEFELTYYSNYCSFHSV